MIILEQLTDDVNGQIEALGSHRLVLIGFLRSSNHRCVQGSVVRSRVVVHLMCIQTRRRRLVDATPNAADAVIAETIATLFAGARLTTTTICTGMTRGGPGKQMVLRVGLENGQDLRSQRGLSLLRRQCRQCLEALQIDKLRNSQLKQTKIRHPNLNDVLICYDNTSKNTKQCHHM